MFMVKCDDKIRTYASSQRALAAADARDYSSILEEYRILSNRTFVRVR